MEKQLEDIELDIKENDIKARQHIKDNQRVLAKSFLRKKHLLEKNHGKLDKNLMKYISNRFQHTQF